MVFISNTPKYLQVSFSPSVLIFSWCGNVSFLASHYYHGAFFFAKFHSYVLTACIKISNSFSFLANSLVSSIIIVIIYLLEFLTSALAGGILQGFE